MDIVEAVATHVLALLAGAAAMRHREVWRRKRRDQEHLTEAAQAIVAELRPLAVLVTKSRDVPLEANEVAEVWRSCAAVIAENDHRLPPTWRHLRRSVRAALGELFGGPAWADISYGDELNEMAEFDGRWWDYVLTYYGYLSERLAQIADRPESAADIEILDFDAWLAVTGRHGDVMTWHRRRWSHRLLEPLLT